MIENTVGQIGKTQEGMEGQQQMNKLSLKKSTRRMYEPIMSSVIIMDGVL